MNIVYLTPDVTEYGGAFYQQDFKKRLNENNTVFNYGPGFDQYVEEDDISQIISKAGIEPEVILFGHSWLGDASDKPVEKYPISLEDISIPTAIMLNKEYTNFDQKVRWISEKGIDMVFTNANPAIAKDIEKKTGAVCHFRPHGVNSEKFKDYGEKKTYDLSFSGILTNPYTPTLESEPQTYIRSNIQKELFWTFKGAKIRKRRKYSDLDLFWRAKPKRKASRLFNRFIHCEKRLPEEDYFRLLNRSKISLSTISPVPVKIISTRFFEVLASRSLLFCPSDGLIESIFTPQEHCVTFNRDLSDFEDNLRYYLENKKERKAIATQGYEYVMENHTWEHRVNQIVSDIEQYTR